MRKFLSMILALTMILGVTLTLASCGERQKADLSGVTDLSGLEGLIISAQSGTFHETARQQIKNVKGQIYPDFDSMLVALKANGIDGYIAEEPTAIAVCAKDPTLAYIHLKNNSTGFTASVEDTAIAIGMKKGSALKARINEVLATISEETRSELMQQMAQLGAGKEIGDIVLSNDTPATTNGKLKVAMECAYDPFNWTQRDASNGAVKISGEGKEGLYANGYDVQIAKYVANALGLELEIYSEKWDSLVPGVESGKYDAIVAGMSPTAERLEKIDFSDIYYSSNLVIIYKK